MKYPRTFHLPWSPGGTKDDKKLTSVESFLHQEIVITEKLDGSNSCLSLEGVFARSHGSSPKHPSFDLLKQRFYSLKDQLLPQEQIFLENCFAVHSITYNQLSDFCFVFNIRQDNLWKSWAEVEKRTKELNLSTSPILFTGKISSVKELESLTTKLSLENSYFGGTREGVVVRLADSFSDTDFKQSVAKWVRKDHVQTPDHWMHQAIVKQKFSYEL